MRFGQSAEEAEKSSRSTGSSGGDFIRYLRDGTTTLRILEEPKDWIYFWEHFNPGTSRSFPCTNDRDTCPGCTSSNEKMKSSSRRASFHALNEYEGKWYVNVWKLPITVADKMKNRFDRYDTLTDRPYSFSRFKSANDRVDYDIEAEEKEPCPDYDPEHVADIEGMLVSAYEEAWGTGKADRQVEERKAAPKAADEEDVEFLKKRLAELEAKEKAKAEDDGLPVDPPSEPEPANDDSGSGDEKVVTEEWLREQNVGTLAKLCMDEGIGQPPAELTETDQIVDWMLTRA